MDRAGVLHGGLPFLAFGRGEPLVILPGLGGSNASPAGLERRWLMRILAPLAGHFTVYVVNRRPGLPYGTTIRDLADQYAAAIRHHFAGPVLVEGVSTGGSIAQQLAIDHPDTIRRLVLADTACRLSPRGRDIQQHVARMIVAGRPRLAYAALGPPMAATTAGGWLMTATMWLAGGWMRPREPNDMLVTIAAEDAFDCSAGLPRVAAATLVVGGERDGFYTPELFRKTAERIPDAVLLLYPGKAHGVALTHRPAVDEILSFLRGGA